MARVLWIVNHYACLPTESGGTRHYWLGRGLQQDGWDVRIIRSGPTGASPWVPTVEDVDGLEVTSVSASRPQARGVARVGGWAAFSALTQMPRTTQHLPKPDLVLGSTVHLGAAWAARALARRHDVPFVLEVRDLWPDTLIALGALGAGSPLARAMRRIEGSLADSAMLIVSPLAGVGRYMADTHRVPLERFVWISNGVDFDNFREVSPPATGGLKMQYFGSMGTTNSLSTLLSAVKEANRELTKPVQLQLLGEGPERDRLVKRVAADPQLKGVVSFPMRVPSLEVADAMAWGNALIMAIRDLPSLYRYGVGMNKLFDYLAGGRWILLDAATETIPIADAPGLTRCGRGESLSEAIIKLAAMDPQSRDRAASGNRNLAEKRFDYAVLAKELSTSLERVRASSVGGDKERRATHIDMVPPANRPATRPRRGTLAEGAAEACAGYSGLFPIRG